MTGRPSADGDQVTRRGLLGTRLRDVRIRSKLGLILIVPLVAIMVLAAVRLVDIAQRAAAAEQVSSLAAVSVAATDVSHQLHRERIEAVRLLAAPSDDADSGRFLVQSGHTDRAVERYEAARAALGSVPGVVNEPLTDLDRHISELEDLRQQVMGDSPASVSVILLRYGVVTSTVLSYHDAVGGLADDPNLAQELRAAAAMSKAKAHAADAEAIALTALADGPLSEEQLATFLATQTGQQEAFLAFGQAATPEQQALADAVVTGGNVVFADRAAGAILRSTGGELAISSESAASSLSGLVGATRWAEERIYSDLLAGATVTRDTVRQQVMVEAAAVVAVLILAVAIALFLARTLTRSLGQLREGALTVANRDLPETVARFSDPQNLGENTPAQVASQVQDPIQLRSRDEIGQVAQAFNVVHQAAVRVAAEQAALRTSVQAMFLNLARRSQTLVDRIINELDDIERNEDDPKRLSRLFALDHLATRMRRNDENLLVLAGADSGPTRTEDAAVADVLRASQSEVEHYARIEFGTVDSDVAVKAVAVNDVVRLVAELFDNATRFSPPNSPVVAEARRLGDQVIIQVEDRGVGMPQDQANQINAWLAAPPAVEFTTFRRMGLAVVGRLAARHQMRVELRSDMRSGTVVYVALPPTILQLPQHRSRPAEIPLPRTPAASEYTQQAPPPLPSRHLGQLPRRSADVVSHAAGRGSSQRAAAGTHGSAAIAEPAGTAAAGTAGFATAGRDLPVAGRPPEALLARVAQQARSGAASAADATAELPIFREMEAVWFRSHGQLDLGQAPPPASTVRQAGTAATASTSTPGAPVSAPAAATGDDGGEQWRTAADSGWSAAARAAEPPAGGATRSGLPKRVPQAQLVPGGVDPASGSPGTQRRSPEEVRGLLSAYHRGVQRGREHGGR